MKRATTLSLLLCSVLAAGAFAADQVRTATGSSRRRRTARRPSACSRGFPYAQPPVGRAALEGAAAGPELDGRPARRQLRTALHAAPRLHRHGVPQQRRERGLSLPERLDAGGVRQGAPAGARLLLRRRLRGGRRVGAALRRRQHGVEGHRGGHGQLPARRLRVPRARRAEPGSALHGVGQLRPAGPERSAPLGEPEHRRVRRRSEAGDDRRRVRRARSRSAGRSSRPCRRT